MLITSLTLSFLMLIVTNVCVCLRKRVGIAALTPWPFLLVGLYPEMCLAKLPTFMLHAALVVVAASVCGILAARRSVFVISSLLATLVSYGLGTYFAVEHVRNSADICPFESLEERLSYESRRDELPRRLGLHSSADKAQTFDADRLVDLELAVENHQEGEYFEAASSFDEYRTQAIHRLHEDQVARFIQSPSFGVGRMSSEEYLARTGEKEVTIPMSSLAGAYSPTVRLAGVPYREPTQELSWWSHRESVADFLNSVRFGYTKDRRHAAGFQPHQFSRGYAFPKTEQAPPRYQLRRLELVSLLKYDQPGVYVTENLPRMDLLRDAQVRPLDNFERDNLRRLWLGDDLAIDCQDGRLRVLGAIRAGKQCLSCHDAQRGDLLGAFSYHLDAAR
jgi:hypothetical protein